MIGFTEETHSLPSLDRTAKVKSSYDHLRIRRHPHDTIFELEVEDEKVSEDHFEGNVHAGYRISLDSFL